MLTHIVWALYLYIGVWAFGDASENVNKVNSPRFFIVFSTALSDYENIQNDKKQHQKRITMKTLRFIGMALTAIILTIGFTACSSDDDDNNGGAGETLLTSNTKLWKAYSNGTDKWGYINENGDFVIAAQYEEVFDFSCGLAKVKTGEKYYFIDTNGKMINSTGFDRALDFANNYASVKKDEVWGLIDKSGSFIIQPIYYSLGNVATNGLLPFKIQSSGKYGFINTKNERMIDPEYNDIYPYGFNNGVACVCVGTSRKWGAINAEGKWVIQPTYNSLESVTGKDLVIFSEKTSGNNSALYGIMDYNGNIKVQALYQIIADNLNGSGILVAKNTSGKYGYIDANGNTIIPFLYDFVTDFFGEYTCVGTKENNKIHYNLIDRDGKILFSLGDGEEFEDTYNGLILTKKSEEGRTTYTYRNKDNKIIYTWTK